MSSTSSVTALGTVGSLLAFGDGHEATGLWSGLSLGLTAVAVLMTLRVLAVSSRPIARR